MTSNASIRRAAVAGSFYPGNAAELRGMIDDMLAASHSQGDAPKVIIAPHAGYIYSGPVAASVYKLLQPVHDKIRRVILLGPSHRVPLTGMATTSADYYATPLGEVRIDREAIDHIQSLTAVIEADLAHAQEHSLEVHVPFLQSVLDEFTLVPLVVGESDPRDVADVLQTLWGGEETLIVISSDLSHYHDYASAQRMDRATSDAIVELRGNDIGYEDACGRNPVCGALEIARQRGMHVETVDLRNSGDTAGPRDSVVGYGAYAMYE